ncbi:MAG: hypothetical protein ABL960_14105 [Nitrospira sp.]
MVCRFCSQHKPLIKAHVIPEGFFRVLRGDSSIPELLSNKVGEYPKRAPIGVYDKLILCRECDGLFSDWDNHAQKVLLQDFSEETAIDGGAAKIGWKVADFDYRALKLFFVSLLWRASVSTHEFYRRVSLGPLEGELRAMIVAEEPGSPEAFAVTLARFDHPAFTGMLDPHLEQYEGVNYCRFYLSGFVAYIKIDQQPAPKFLSDFIIREGAPIIVLLRNAQESKDTLVMREIAMLRLRRERSSPEGKN